MINKRYYNWYDESWSVNRRYWSFSGADEPDSDPDDLDLEEDFYKSPATNVRYRGIQRHTDRKMTRRMGLLNKGVNMEFADFESAFLRRLNDG